MKISYQKVEILKQAPTELGIYKIIERAARVCYKSENKIDGESYKHMLNLLRTNGHYSAFEHGTVYLQVPAYNDDLLGFYITNHYSRFNIIAGMAYITTNYRVLVENGREADLQYICAPTPHHAKRITVHFTSDISVNREANRHRVNSINEESTIYCNYANDKFGNEIAISKPVWITDEEIATSCVYNDHGFDQSFQDICHNVANGTADESWGPVDFWAYANACAEYCYMNLIRLGWKPKQARTILPLDTKSELIHTAYVDEWINFFHWRCTEAHPQIKALACELRDLFIAEGYAPENELLNPKKLIY